RIDVAVEARPEFGLRVAADGGGDEEAVAPDDRAGMPQAGGGRFSADGGALLGGPGGGGPLAGGGAGGARGAGRGPVQGGGDPHGFVVGARLCGCRRRRRRAFDPQEGNIRGARFHHKADDLAALPAEGDRPGTAPRGPEGVLGGGGPDVQGPPPQAGDQFAAFGGDPELQAGGALVEAGVTLQGFGVDRKRGGLGGRLGPGLGEQRDDFGPAGRGRRQGP